MSTLLLTVRCSRDTALHVARRACAALAVCSLAFATSPAMATEEPKFELIEKAGDFELRRYAPMIVAETWVEGVLSEGSNAGFRLIAGYIFGDNTSRGAKAGGSEKIAMTVPVTMEPGAQKIAMTAPVVTESASATPPSPVGSDAVPGKDERWRMHFVMPSRYTMETLPVPNNPRVSLREIPAQQIAVRIFSGFVTEQRVREETAALHGWMKARGLAPVGAPQLARYNPPWSIPFLRRNEILQRY
jgi:hypothetical protein